MKILIVATDYFNESNGLCISTQRFIECFKSHGHEVRVTTNNRNGVSEYPLEVYKLPLVNGLCEREGYTFAKKDEKILTEAINWCDIVHLEDPFPLCKYTAKLARKLNKPVTATFHLYPENMTFAANITWMHIEGMIMRYFRSAFKYAELVQCPTKIVKKRLEKWHFKGELVAVTNGIIPSNIHEVKKEKPEELKDKFIVLTIGRYSKEKNQQELLRAIALSKYKDNIKVIIAGKGPLESKLVKLNEKLKLDCKFGFYSQEELNNIRSYSDIYVHCARIEVEGMSCMEAFAAGCVPVIAKNKLSSTWIYALDDKNMYNSKNVKELARKIDYWYENREELKEYRLKYLALSKDLLIEKSAEEMLGHFERIINNHKKK